MDPHTLRCLELTAVCEMVAEHAHTSLGRAMAMRLKPTTRELLIGQWHAQVREMLAAIAAVGAPPFGGLRDIRETIRHAVPPATIEPDDLGIVVDALRAACNVRDWAQRLPETCPQLRAITERVGDFRYIVAQIDRVIDNRGGIRDNATDRLLKLRNEICNARANIQRVVDRLLKDPHATKWLRYAEATFHDDRLVVPLAAEHRGRIPGIVHRTSDSGATLFVEPAEAVELNNTIVRLRRDEADEIGRILWRITHQIHLNQKTLLVTLDALAVLDLIATKARFAQAYDMTCPRIGEGRPLKLRNVRHPLLLRLQRERRLADEDPIDVVPIDVRLGEDFDLLVVTGPNTGGKTVALKTVGLIALMAQAGLPIPADPGAELPVYDHVLIDVGDEQSLEQSLSTFSAHMTRLLDMLKRATSRTLVLVDELGAGTDPDEGAAIGRAVVEELLRIGCHTMVTTHLGALKSVAFTAERADNAAVEFDVQTLQPTYHLRIGEPGNSNAIAIARRLGMPGRLMRRARQLLSRRGRALEKAIAGTLHSRREAERARGQAESAKVEAEKARTELESQRQRLARDQAAFADWTRAVAQLRPGDTVFVAKFDREGSIVRMQFQKQTAVVCVGAIELEVPLTELRLPDQQRP
jgi:DNA mismatch repair protein MutS2